VGVHGKWVLGHWEKGSDRTMGVPRAGRRESVWKERCYGPVQVPCVVQCRPGSAQVCAVCRCPVGVVQAAGRGLGGK